MPFNMPEIIGSTATLLMRERRLSVGVEESL